MGDREEGLDLRIARARKTMIARADNDLHPPQPSTISSPAVTPGGQNDDTMNNKPVENPTSTPEREIQNITSPSTTTKVEGGPPQTSGEQTPKRKQKKVATSKLYSIVIFDEFLKELAAISQEQSIVSPVLYCPTDDNDDDDVT